MLFFVQSVLSCSGPDSPDQPPPPLPPHSAQGKRLSRVGVGQAPPAQPSLQAHPLTGERRRGVGPLHFKDQY